MSLSSDQLGPILTTNSPSIGNEAPEPFSKASEKGLGSEKSAPSQSYLSWGWQGIKNAGQRFTRTAGQHAETIAKDLTQKGIDKLLDFTVDVEQKHAECDEALKKIGLVANPDAPGAYEALTLLHKRLQPIFIELINQKLSLDNQTTPVGTPQTFTQRALGLAGQFIASPAGEYLLELRGAQMENLFDVLIWSLLTNIAVSTYGNRHESIRNPEQFVGEVAEQFITLNNELFNNELLDELRTLRDESEIQKKLLPAADAYFKLAFPNGHKDLPLHGNFIVQYGTKWVWDYALGKFAGILNDWRKIVIEPTRSPDLVGNAHVLNGHAPELAIIIKKLSVQAPRLASKMLNDVRQEKYSKKAAKLVSKEAVVLQWLQPFIKKQLAGIVNENPAQIELWKFISGSIQGVVAHSFGALMLDVLGEKNWLFDSETENALGSIVEYLFKKSVSIVESINSTTYENIQKQFENESKDALRRLSLSADDAEFISQVEYKAILEGSENKRKAAIQQLFLPAAKEMSQMLHLSGLPYYKLLDKQENGRTINRLEHEILPSILCTLYEKLGEAHRKRETYVSQICEFTKTQMQAVPADQIEAEAKAQVESLEKIFGSATHELIEAVKTAALNDMMPAEVTSAKTESQYKQLLSRFNLTDVSDTFTAAVKEALVNYDYEKIAELITTERNTWLWLSPEEYADLAVIVDGRIMAELNKLAFNHTLDNQDRNFLRAALKQIIDSKNSDAEVVQQFIERTVVSNILKVISGFTEALSKKGAAPSAQSNNVLATVAEAFLEEGALLVKTIDMQHFAQVKAMPESKEKTAEIEKLFKPTAKKLVELLGINGLPFYGYLNKQKKTYTKNIFEDQILPKIIYQVYDEMSALHREHETYIARISHFIQSQPSTSAEQLELEAKEQIAALEGVLGKGTRSAISTVRKVLVSELSDHVEKRTEKVLERFKLINASEDTIQALAEAIGTFNYAMLEQLIADERQNPLSAEDQKSLRDMVEGKIIGILNEKIFKDKLEIKERRFLKAALKQIAASEEPGSQELFKYIEGMAVNHVLKVLGSLTETLANNELDAASKAKNILGTFAEAVLKEGVALVRSIDLQEFEAANSLPEGEAKQAAIGALFQPAAKGLVSTLKLDELPYYRFLQKKIGENTSNLLEDRILPQILFTLYRELGEAQRQRETYINKISDFVKAQKQSLPHEEIELEAQKETELLEKIVGQPAHFILDTVKKSLVKELTAPTEVRLQNTIVRFGILNVASDVRQAIKAAVEKKDHSKLERLITLERGGRAFTSQEQEDLVDLVEGKFIGELNRRLFGGALSMTERCFLKDALIQMMTSEEPGAQELWTYIEGMIANNVLRMMSGFAGKLLNKNAVSTNRFHNVLGSFAIDFLNEGAALVQSIDPQEIEKINQLPTRMAKQEEIEKLFQPISKQLVALLQLNGLPFYKYLEKKEGEQTVHLFEDKILPQIVFKLYGDFTEVHTQRDVYIDQLQDFAKKMMSTRPQAQLDLESKQLVVGLEAELGKFAGKVLKLIKSSLRVNGKIHEKAIEEVNTLIFNGSLSDKELEFLKIALNQLIASQEPGAKALWKYIESTVVCSTLKVVSGLTKSDFFLQAQQKVDAGQGSLLVNYAGKWATFVHDNVHALYPKVEARLRVEERRVLDEKKSDTSLQTILQNGSGQEISDFIVRRNFGADLTPVELAKGCRPEIDALFTEFTHQALAHIFPEGPNSLPIPAFAREISYNLIHAQLNKLIATSYLETIPWIFARENNAKDLKEIYKTTKVEQAIIPVARFVRDFVPYIVTKERSKIAEAAVNGAQKLADKEHIAPLKNALNNKDEAKQFVEKAIDELKNAPETEQVLDDLEKITDATLIQLSMNVTRRFEDFEKANPNFMLDLTTDIMELAAEHFEGINAVKEEVNRIRKTIGVAEADSPHDIRAHTMHYAFDHPKTPGVPQMRHPSVSSPDATEDEKKETRLQKLFLPMAAKVLAAVGINSPDDLPVPPASRKLAYKLVVEQLVPEILHEIYKNTIDPHTLNMIVLGALEGVEKGLDGYGKKTKEKPQPNKKALPPYHQQARLNRACASLFSQVLAVAPPSPTQMLLTKSDKIRNMVGSTAGKALREQIAKVSLLDLVKQGVHHVGHHAFHAGKWSGEPGSEVLNPYRIVRIEEDGTRVLEPVPEGQGFKFHFAITPEEKAAKQAQKDKDIARVEAKLKVKARAVANKAVRVALKATIRGIWDSIQRFLDKICSKIPGLMAIKKVFDVICRAIFITALGAVLKVLLYPLNKFIWWIISRHVKEKVDIVGPMIKMPIHESLAANIFERLINKLSEKLPQSLDKTNAATSVPPVVVAV